MQGRPVEGVDYEALAAKTNLYSGADLAHLCETATEQALEDSIAAGAARPIRPSDFAKALKEVRPSTRPWFGTARNYAMFANEGGLYDDLLAFMKAHKL
jgi:SpoVK/Ycf46/Vps4 family AAA+-type ATPase